MAAPPDPTTRFSDRVESYVRYRPGYPPEALDVLAAEGLSGSDIVADIGSGTGILSRLFLERGHKVFGVEPNAPMRAAAEKLLFGYPRFRSIEGSAEATTLENGSADLAVAGQAFHWFDRGRAPRSSCGSFAATPASPSSGTTGERPGRGSPNATRTSFATTGPTTRPSTTRISTAARSTLFSGRERGR